MQPYYAKGKGRRVLQRSRVQPQVTPAEQPTVGVSRHEFDSVSTVTSTCPSTHSFLSHHMGVNVCFKGGSKGNGVLF